MYYDPDAGRFVTHDPIGLLGGENLYAFAPNVRIWVDFLGLAKGAAKPVFKAAIEVWKRAHKNYSLTLGGGYDFESSFRGRGKGNKQLNNYVRVLNSEGPDSRKGKWEGILDFYKP